MAEKVIVGMSGGVDSAVAAYLLQKQGYEVIGLTLRTWESGESRCCAIDDARETARRLGIRYEVRNCASQFHEKVERPFVESYLSGLTPSPCVSCNRTIKWEQMLYAAAVLGADLVATGHYASVVRLPNGRYAVKKAADREKDQSYMLSQLTQEQLAHTVFPLGEMTKANVRALAERESIPAARRPDSQEICFVTEGHYSEYVEENAETPVPGEGDIIDTSGAVLGRHRGIYRYTIGQRRGLGVSGGRPLYVVGKDVSRNTVVLGDEKDLFSKTLTAGSINWMSVPELSEPMRVSTKIRFSQTTADAVVYPAEDGRVTVEFSEAQRAATPGQAVVFYDGDLVVGGGFIE